ncbi:hypothetical protein [Candidatus Poriferisocius sp.]|uniref:hypothetical protein n=1 Tax=Candidatus Poriferisocius sp. TaxID=3101276 RepID=UPI003B59C48A
MLVDEARRLALLSRLSEVLGEEEARTLIECLPPVRWEHLATKDDVKASEDRIRTEMNGKFALVDAEFARVHTRIDGLEHKMDGLEHKMEAGFESLRGETALQMAKLTRTMVFIMSGFMLTIWGTMLGIGLT